MRERSERKERRREMSLLYVGETVTKEERKLSIKAAYSSLPSARGAQSLSPTAVYRSNRILLSLLNAHEHPTSLHILCHKRC